MIIIELVHLEGLQFKRQQPAFGINLKDKNTAIYLFTAQGHFQHLPEILLAGYIAVLRFTPLTPKVLKLSVQVFIVGLCLHVKALADNITLEGS